MCFIPTNFPESQIIGIGYKVNFELSFAVLFVANFITVFVFSHKPSTLFASLGKAEKKLQFIIVECNFLS